MAEIINRYQLTVNLNKIRKDAYFACKNNTVCSQIVDTSDSEIANYIQSSAYRDLENTAMTNEQWQAAREKAE